MVVENKAIKTEDNRIVLEHRYIMEQHLGRILGSDEVVHHINGNHNDNRLENLQVMTKSEHSILHGKHTELSNVSKKQRNSGKASKNISMDENLIKKAEIRAKSLGFNFSSYLTFLINRDLDTRYVYVPKGNIINNETEISTAPVNITGREFKTISDIFI